MAEAVDSTIVSNTSVLCRDPDPPWLIWRSSFEPGQGVPDEVKHSVVDNTLVKDGKALQSLDVIVLRGSEFITDLYGRAAVNDSRQHGSTWKQQVPFKTPHGQCPVYLSVGIDYDEIRQWLKKDEHDNKIFDPVLKRENPKGTRFIDCESDSFEAVPRQHGQPYVALSYVWGGVDLHQDHRTNKATITDAMTVVRQLGLRYLWVDRYCIDQTDEQLEHHMIRNMDLVHRGATITIVDASGKHADHGLPGVSQRY